MLSFGNGINALMGPERIVVVDIPDENVPDLTFVYDEEIVESFGTDRFDETFGNGVHVWSFNGSADFFNVVE